MWWQRLQEGFQALPHPTHRPLPQLLLHSSYVRSLCIAFFLSLSLLLLLLLLLLLI
jgi:hypothetical protein